MRARESDKERDRNLYWTLKMLAPQTAGLATSDGGEHSDAEKEIKEKKKGKRKKKERRDRKSVV